MVLVAAGFVDEGEEARLAFAQADAFDEIGADARVRVGEEVFDDFSAFEAAAEDFGDFGLNPGVGMLAEAEQHHGEAPGGGQRLDDDERSHDLIEWNFLGPQAFIQHAAEQFSVEHLVGFEGDIGEFDCLLVCKQFLATGYIKDDFAIE